MLFFCEYSYWSCVVGNNMMNTVFMVMMLHVVIITRICAKYSPFVDLPLGAVNDHIFLWAPQEQTKHSSQPHSNLRVIPALRND